MQRSEVVQDNFAIMEAELSEAKLLSNAVSCSWASVAVLLTSAAWQNLMALQRPS